MSTSYMVVALAGILALSFVIFRLLSRRRALKRGPVWAGGLRHLSPGMTYTATGFSNPVRVIFEAVLHPAAGEDNVEAVARHFRTAIVRNNTEAHIVDRLVLAASGRRAAVARGHRAQDACRKRQRLCSLRSLDLAGCAGPRRRNFLSIFRPCHRGYTGSVSGEKTAKIECVKLGALEVRAGLGHGAVGRGRTLAELQEEFADEAHCGDVILCLLTRRAANSTNDGRTKAASRRTKRRLSWARLLCGLGH